MDFCIIMLMFSFFAIVVNIAITKQTNCNKDVKLVINCILWIINVALIIILATKVHPTAIDAYRGNTEMEIRSVNGIPTDTIIVYKKK